MNVSVHATISFSLSGVASLWRAHFSDLDYSWAEASSGLLILDEFLNGHSAQVRNQVLVSTKWNSQFDMDVQTTNNYYILSWEQSLAPTVFTVKMFGYQDHPKL